MRMIPVEIGDRWFVCDSNGRKLLENCPCCTRPMLTRDAAVRVIEEIERMKQEDRDVRSS